MMHDDVPGHVGDTTLEIAQLHASPDKTERLIRQRIGERQQVTVAAAMDIQPSGISRWLAGHADVPLARIGSLLAALDLEIVPREELAALRLFAGRHLTAGRE